MFLRTMFLRTMFVRLRLGYLPFLVIAGAALASGASSALYDVDSGEARAGIRGDQLVLENNMLSARWFLAGGGVSGGELIVHPLANVSEKNVALSQNIFVLKFKDGKILRSSAMTVKDGPRVEKLDAQPDASRVALQSTGQQVV